MFPTDLGLFSHKKGSGMTTNPATIEIAGSKNAALPLVFAALTVPGRHKFTNFPIGLGDVATTLNWLAEAGLKTSVEEDAICLDSNDISTNLLLLLPFVDIRYSLLLLGICLGRAGVGSVPIAGGCKFAVVRPFDIHLDLFRQLGADVAVTDKRITARLEGATSSARLRFPSVGATLNFIMFAACRRGAFELNGVALEPEIVDVLDFLKLNGIDYSLDTCRRVLRIRSNGACHHRTVHEVIPDRVEAITWLVFSCLFRQPLLLTCANNLDVVLPQELLYALGAHVSSAKNTLVLHGHYDPALLACYFSLGPYPLLATDYGPILLLLGSISPRGVTVQDSVTPHRYTFLDILYSHGIRVSYDSYSATLFPVGGKFDEFSARSTDLRGAVALLLFGMRFARNVKFYSLGQVLRGWHGCQNKLARFGISFTQKEDHALVNGPQ